MYGFYDYAALVDFAGKWAAFYGPMTVKISLMLAAFLLATKLMRRASASSRHLVWALGVAGLLCFPVMEAALPSWEVLPFHAHSSSAAERLEAAAGISQFNAGEDKGKTEGAGSKPNTGAVSSKAEAGPASGRSANPSSKHSDASGTTSSAAVAPGAVAAVRMLLDKLAAIPAALWAFSIWATGVIALGLYFVWGMIRLNLLRREAEHLTCVEWQRMARRLSAGLRLSSTPVLLRSPRAITPMTWGLRKATVLLPEDCDTWTEEQRREVLLHEFAHIMRRDCLTQLSAQLMCILHWFNPLAWMAARQMRTERERACDDHVIMAGVRPSTYASHLLSIACRLRGEEQSLRAGLAMARRSHLFDRLDAVLGTRRRRLSPGRSATLLAGVLILATLSPLAALDPAAEARVVTAGDHVASVLVEDGPGPIRARWTGDIELTEDGGAVDWMSDDAYLVLAQKMDGVWRKVMVEPNSDGNLEYTYMVDRKLSDFDAEAADWLAEVLKAVAPRGKLDERKLAADVSLPSLPSLPELPSLVELPSLPAGTSLSINTEGSDRHVTWNFDDDNSTTKVEMRGEIEFNDDDSGISWMDDDSYFKIEEKRGGERHRLEAEPDGDGRPVYEYRVGRKERPFDEKAQQWLAAALKKGLVELGIDADRRVKRIYERSGTAGVLKLTGGIDSDYSKSIHYREFFALKDLNGRETEDALRQAAEEVDSDYELARVLAAYVDRFLVTGYGHDGFLRCMSAIDSDYEKARVLKTALARPNLNAEGLSVIWEAAKRIDSDYETARVLSAVDPDLLSHDKGRELYFGVLVGISSDYEKAMVLLELAPYARENKDLREACLDAADSIDSEYEYSRVMRILR